MEDLNERPIKVSKITDISAGVVDVPIGDIENYVNGGILSSKLLKLAKNSIPFFKSLNLLRFNHLLANLT